MNEQTQIKTLQIAAVVSFVLAIVNHLLPPGSYPATQLLFSYDFGFLRRGLTGELLSMILPGRVTVEQIRLVTFCMTLAGAVAFGVMAAKRLAGGVPQLLLLIIVFNSFAFTSFIGATGYLDSILMVLVVLALAVPATSVAGLAVRTALLLLGALVHEIMVPYFLALIAFDIWLAEPPARRWRAFLPVGASVVIVLALFTKANLDPALAEAFIDSVRARAGFVPDKVNLAVAGDALSAHQAFTAEAQNSGWQRAMYMFDGVPLTLMALWIWWLGGKMIGEGREIDRLALLAVVAAPVTLNLVAIDVARFGAASVLSGFLALGIILLRVPGARERLAEHFGLGHAMIVLVLNANVFTMSFSSDAGHTAQAPWVWIVQRLWFEPAPPPE